MALRGARELRARLRAIHKAPKPMGKEWAGKTVRLAKGRVKVKTGKTKRSIRRRSLTERKATVEVGGGGRFLEAGAKAHTISAKRFQALRFNVAGRPAFARKVRHPGAPKQPFLRRSGRDALKDADMLKAVIEEWNRAA